MSTTVNEKIQQWIKTVFESLQFTNVTSEVQGTSAQGDGYAGNIAFAEVTGSKPGKSSEKFDVVVKYGKDDFNEILRDLMIKAYDNEIFYYQTLIPEFRRFEETYGVTTFKDMKPKPFGSISAGADRVLILENLKSLGFEMHDKRVPFDLKHSKLTFTQYAKFHAHSLAMQQLNPKKWNELFDGIESLFDRYMKELDYSLLKSGEKAIFMYLEAGEPKLLSKIKSLYPGGLVQAWESVRSRTSKRRVLIHGDCWNNNMMFKYSNSLQEPEQIALIDFQVFDYQSPALDLSHNLYSTAGDEVFENFEELLHTYHETLNKVLKQFGVDEGVYLSYEELLEEWKTFSFFGIILMCILLPLTFCEGEDTITSNDMIDTNLDMAKRLNDKTTEKLIKRVVSAFKHYFKYSGE